MITTLFSITQRYIGLSLALFTSTSLLACRCGEQYNVEIGLDRSTIAFKGKVISKELNMTYDSLSIYADVQPLLIVKIKLEQLYKGQVTSDTLTILTPPNGSSCGYRFNIGTEYIVYATQVDELNRKSKQKNTSPNTFYTHHCSRTQVWNIKEEQEICTVLH